MFTESYLCLPRYKLLLFLALIYFNTLQNSYAGFFSSNIEQQDVVPFCKEVLNQIKSAPVDSHLSNYLHACMYKYLVPVTVKEPELTKEIAKLITSSNLNDLVDKTLSTPLHSMVITAFGIMNAYIYLGNNNSAITYNKMLLDKSSTNTNIKYIANSLSIPAFVFLNDMNLTKENVDAVIKSTNKHLRLSLIQSPQNLILKAWQDLFTAANALQNRNYTEVIEIRDEWLEFRNRNTVSIAEKFIRKTGFFNFDLAILYCIGTFGSTALNDFDLSFELFNECKQLAQSLKDKKLSQALDNATNTISNRLKIASDSSALSIQPYLETNKIPVREHQYFYYFLLATNTLETSNKIKLTTSNSSIENCTKALSIAKNSFDTMSPKDFVLDAVFDISICFESINYRGINKKTRADIAKLLKMLDETIHANDWRYKYTDIQFSSITLNKKQNLIHTILSKGFDSELTKNVSLIDAVFSSKSLESALSKYIDNYISNKGCKNFKKLYQLIDKYKKYIHPRDTTTTTNLIDLSETYKINIYIASKSFISILRHDNFYTGVCKKFESRSEMLNKIELLKASLIENRAVSAQSELISYFELDQILNNQYEIHISPHGQFYEFPWLILRTKKAFLVQNRDLIVETSSNDNTHLYFLKGKPNLNKNGQLKSYGDDILSITAHGQPLENIFNFKIRLDKKLLGINEILKLTSGYKALVFNGCGFGQTNTRYYDAPIIGKNSVGIYQEILRSGIKKIIVTIKPDLDQQLEDDFARIFSANLNSGKSFKASFFSTIRRFISDSGLYPNADWWPYIYVR